jgi:YD repeat-containing protein
LPGLAVTESQNRPITPLRSSDPPYFETHYEWNSDSLLTRVIRPNGNSTINIYEADILPAAPVRSRGNLRRRQQLAGPLGADQTSIAETFEYDTAHGGCCGFNFVTRHTDARGNLTVHSYDARGNRSNTVHRIPAITEDFEYNEFGQLVKHIHPDNGSNWRRIDRYTYYSPADGLQNGYLKEEIIDANNLALTTRYHYDAVGNAIGIVDARGNSGHYQYNQLDQIVRQTSRSVDGTASGIRHLTDKHYDANNNLVRIDRQNVDAGGVMQANAFFTVLHEYDVLNQRTQTTREADETNNVTTQFAYNANRQVVSKRSGEAVEGRQPANVIAYSMTNAGFPSARSPHRVIPHNRPASMTTTRMATAPGWPQASRKRPRSSIMFLTALIVWHA